VRADLLKPRECFRDRLDRHDPAGKASLSQSARVVTDVRPDVDDDIDLVQQERSPSGEVVDVLQAHEVETQFPERLVPEPCRSAP
jgi:hypothetical protein